MRLKSCRSVHSISLFPSPSPSASIALYLPRIYICHLEEGTPGMHLAQRNGREVKQVSKKNHLCCSLMPLFPLSAYLQQCHTRQRDEFKQNRRHLGSAKTGGRASGGAKTHLAQQNAPEIWACSPPLAETVNECKKQKINKITTIKQGCAMLALDEHVSVRSTRNIVDTHAQVKQNYTKRSNINYFLWKKTARIPNDMTVSPGLWSSFTACKKKKKRDMLRKHQVKLLPSNRHP